MGKRRARNSYSSYRKLSSLSLFNKEWWISSYWSIIIIILINDHYNQILHRKAVGKRGSSSYSSYRKSSSLQNIVNIVVAIIIIIIITAVQDNYSFLHQEIRGETKHVESWWFERLLLVASAKSPTKWLNFQQKAQFLMIDEYYWWLEPDNNGWTSFSHLSDVVSVMEWWCLYLWQASEYNFWKFHNKEKYGEVWLYLPEGLIQSIRSW